MTGTHTLKLEFSRKDSYEISTGMANSYEHTAIEAEFVDEVLIQEISDNFAPEDIFSEDILIGWAENFEQEKI